MASNNEVNKILTAPTITGTVNLNTTSGTVTIGNSSGGALTLASNVNSTWTCANTFNLLTGTGNIQLSGSSVLLINSSMAALNIQTGGATLACTNSSSPFIITKLGAGNITVNQTGTGSLTINGNSSVSIGASIVPTQIQIGNTASAFNGVIGNTTSTTSVSITTGTGNINIGTSIAKSFSIGQATGTSTTFSAGTGGFKLPSIEVTGTSATMVIGIAYVANNGSLVTLTLPTTAATGTLIKVAGFGAGGWKIAQNASQNIKTGAATTTTTGTGGSLSSGGRYDCVELICGTANTTWMILNNTGTLTFV